MIATVSNLDHLKIEGIWFFKKSASAENPRLD